MTKPRAQKSITFYPSDYAGDDELAACSMAAQGFWMRCLCLAARHEGYVLVGGRAVSVADLAHATRVRAGEVDQVEGWISELIARGVCDVTDDGHPLGPGVMINRRMERAKAEHEKHVENGRKGGNPMLVGQRDNELALIDEAARNAIRREQARLRNQAYRERKRSGKRDAARDARDANRDAKSVTRDVTPASRKSSRERHADEENSTDTKGSGRVTQDNPRLKAHTIPYHTIRESHSALPSSTPDDRPSHLTAAGPSGVADSHATPAPGDPADVIALQQRARDLQLEQLRKYAAAEAGEPSSGATLAASA